MGSILSNYDEVQLRQKFISALDETKHGEFQKFLRNQSLMHGSTDHLPKSLDLVIESAARFQTTVKPVRTDKTNSIFSMREGQQEKDWHTDATCYACQKKGHISTFCPNKESSKDKKKKGGKAGYIDKKQEQDKEIAEAIADAKAEKKKDSKSEVKASAASGGAAEKTIRRSVIMKVTKLKQSFDLIVGLDTQANCSLMSDSRLVERMTEIMI